MKELRLRISLALLIPFLFLFQQADAFEKITIRINYANRPPSYLKALDLGGALYVSSNDFATHFSLPFAVSRERSKFEIRLPHHRLKMTAHNPFVVITEVATNVSSVYQVPTPVQFLDSLYYAPAHHFFELVERFSGVGVSWERESRTLSYSTTPPPPGPQFDITGIELEPRLNGYLLTVKANRKLNEYEALLKQNDGWLFVTIANANADTNAIKQFKTGPIVRQILTFQSPTSVQLTFRVGTDVARAEPLTEEGTNNLMIALHTRAEVEKEELERRKQELIRERLERERSRQKLDVIVIDAGHGGKDPGTIGVNKTREKDVTLAVALKLGALIEKSMKDVKVVYTRKNDRFVELYRRTQIANEADGKLFVSIHCNSTERKPSSANGFEIYLLRPGKTESATRIAERENSVIQLEEGYEDRYKELTEENFILVAMRQSAFVRYSERFAEIASETMANQLKIRNSGVKQAGFYVLVGASMPNVLVETGYLSNRNEERVLRSKDGQQKIAEALFEGIKHFKEMYDKALDETRSGS
jgi:N-acetylmuramoyl-L-alanine amidase